MVDEAKKSKTLRISEETYKKMAAVALISNKTVPLVFEEAAAEYLQGRSTVTEEMLDEIGLTLKKPTRKKRAK